MPLPRAVLPVVLALLGTITLASCGGTLECTEIGCEHEAVVTYPAGLVAGPYDLSLMGDRGTLSVRCNDPEHPEAAQRSEGIECDNGGFTLRGIELANSRSLRVTLVDAATEEVRAANVEATLNVVEEFAPNGPECEPICFVRNGRLFVDTDE